MDGTPMPLPMTEILLPLYVPVKPSMLRTVLKHTASLKYVSASVLARSGSPGMSTTGEISSGSAWMQAEGEVITDIFVFSFLIQRAFSDFPYMERGRCPFL